MNGWTFVNVEGEMNWTIAEYNNASGFGDSSVTVDRQGRIID